MKSENELREELRQVETQMGAIARRVKGVDEVLNVGLKTAHVPGSSAAIKEYLAWLDGVEALGISFVNGNIVTQRLRLFYTIPDRKDNKDADPSPRMREVKNLLEAVRHKDQGNLLLLRAKRHSVHALLQKAERDASRRAGRQVSFADMRRRIQSAIWLQITVVVVIILLGGVIIESFKPEIIHFVRATVGLRDGPPGPASGPVPASQQDQGRARTSRERNLSGMDH
jgi:hypothetical protein